MNCSQARAIAIEKLTTTIELEKERSLNGHLNECDSCDLISWVLYCVDEVWEYALRHPDEPYSQPEGGDPIDHSGPLGPDEMASVKPSALLSDSIDLARASPVERVYLLSPRTKLRRMIAYMEELAAQIDSERLDTCLKAFRNHLRWADNLACKSKLLNETMYSPDRGES